jgi:beta-galactosidase/beta-glucuronidase
VLREGTLDIDLAPNQKTVIDLELNRITNTECYLNLELRTKEDNAFSEAGHIVAEEQFVINEFENTYDELESDEELIVSDTYGSLRIMGEDIANIRL